MPLGSQRSTQTFSSSGWLSSFTKQLAYFHRHQVDQGGKVFMQYGGEALTAKLADLVSEATEELYRYQTLSMIEWLCGNRSIKALVFTHTCNEASFTTQCHTTLHTAIPHTPYQNNKASDIQEKPITIQDLKPYHTFSFLLEASAKRTLDSITEKLVSVGAAHSASSKALARKAVKVSAAAPKSSEPTDEELLARLFV